MCVQYITFLSNSNMFMFSDLVCLSSFMYFWKSLFGTPTYSLFDRKTTTKNRPPIFRAEREPMVSMVLYDFGPNFRSGV